MTRDVSRRDFLLFVTGTAGAFLVSCRPLEGGRSNTTVPTLIPDDFEVGKDREQGSQPSGFSNPDPQFSEVTYDVETHITSTDRFFVQGFNRIPTVDIDEWTFIIDGLVDNPITLTYDNIVKLDAVTEMRTLECIGNPLGGELIGNATWTGFRLKPLLEEAGIQDSAIRVRFYAADEYSTAVDLEWVQQDGTLMVYAMNGEPLIAEHGFPLRIMMPGLYGQKMPKWITRIEFIGEKYLGFWEKNGWSDIAAVKTNSQIVMPPNLSTIRGAIVLQGWAYAGKRAITGVDVQIDDGEWMPCELLPGPSPLAWTQWWTTWAPEKAGSFKVSVRATDEDGFTQNKRGQLLASAYPDGTDAIHSLAYNADDE